MPKSSKKLKFPGQVEVLIFNLEQVRAVSSVTCAEVLSTVTGEEAISIREIAQEIGKSPASVGAHVKTLLDAGILLEVGSRKRRSRTEALYVRKGFFNRVKPEGQSLEFVEQFVKLYRAILRLADRQQEAFKRVAIEMPEIWPYGQLLHHQFWLTKENVMVIRKKMRELQDLAHEMDEKDVEKWEDGNHVQIHLYTMITPTLRESSRLKEGQPKKKSK